ncbi:MAG: peptidoglycan DD-metalloendopeptidase family protein [Rhodanobacter sp.]|jgi:septal ring factor EnvC (AmiA/AmiB activator)|nr:peptidoglycan DD-metalloendopeptidase family protein [Rhodanobacter sp.]
MRIARQVLAIVVCFAVVAPVLARAQESADTSAPKQEQDAQKKLNTIRSEIETLAAQQRAVTDRRSDAARTLREKELALAAIAKDVRALDEKLAAQQSRLDELEKRRTVREARLAAQRETLANLLRSAYAMGRDEELKLLLQQDDAAATARVLAYHRYFQRAQIELIDTLLDSLKQLVELRESIRTATAQLQATRDARNTDAARLETQRGERAALVGSIDAHLKDSRARIDALGKDEAAVTQIVGRLRNVFADIPERIANQESFTALRGRLAWPLPGKIVTAFGAVDESGRSSSGVLLATPTGTPVHAISHGRVAFADWLRGYGLMLIVDHGDGYLSLYGCNETLLKDVGDWVNAGDTIATSGASGGQKVPGLYFELRAKGRAIDPRGWLH